MGAPDLKNAWVGLVGALLLSAAAWAGGAPRTEKGTVRVPHVTRAPKLSDFLEGRAREAEAVLTDFRQREPNDGQSATLPTATYLSYDDKNFYAVFVCKEDPARLRAHLSKREEFSGDDWVSLTLDTFHDGHRAYMFYSNPLGVQKDGITTEGQADDYSFDTLWYSEGRLTTDGYIVWIAIPFRSMRFPTAPGSTWGVALARYIPSNKEIFTWPYITDRIEAYVPQFATLEGLEQTRLGRNVQLIPYGSFAQQRFLDTPSNGPARITHQTEWRGGLDAKVILHDTLTIDVTLDPDFSQVESDEPQVTVNRRFEVFFPERRPFFTDGAGYFETPETLFFSRRIADPQYGLRLTGKLGSWGLGALVIDDRAPGRLRALDDPLLGRHAKIGVARVQYAFSGQSNLGVLFTRREFGSGSNQVISVDTRLKLNPNWVLTAQAIHSGTQFLDGSRSSGNAYFAEIRHSGRRFNYYSFYRDRSPDFNARLGFIPRVDIRQVKSVASWRWWRETGPVVNHGPGIFAFTNWDHQGRLQDWSVETPYYFNLKGPMSFIVGRVESFEFFDGHGFRKNESYLTFRVDKLRWLGVSGSYDRSNAINFFPASGRSSFLGRATDAGLSITVRPTSRMRLEEKYIYSRLGTFAASQLAGVTPGTAVFNNHILRTKLNYQFTRALSLRAILDYKAVLQNPALVDLDRSKQLTYDILFTYLPHPGTAIYLGYTDRRENFVLDSTDPSGLRRGPSPSLSTGRQFFIKISYLFRF